MLTRLLSRPPPRQLVARCARAFGDYRVGTDKDSFRLPEAAIADFKRDGYVVVRGLLTEAEVAGIEAIYDKVMRREINIPGKDFCDMSKVGKSKRL